MPEPALWLESHRSYPGCLVLSSGSPWENRGEFSWRLPTFRRQKVQPRFHRARGFHAAAAGTVLTPGTRYFTLQRGVQGSNGPIVWSNVAGYTDLQGADQQVQWTVTGSDEMQWFRVLVRLEP